MSKRGQNARRGNRNGKFEFKGFIPVDFSADRIRTIQEWLQPRSMDYQDTLVAFTEAGYKFSTRYLDYGSCYSFSLTCHNAKSDYYGYCLTCQHSDFERGMGVLLYLFTELLSNSAIALPGETDPTNL